MGDQGPNVFQRFFLVLAAVVGHATDFIVSGRTAQRFVVDGFANGRFHQIAARQENRA